MSAGPWVLFCFFRPVVCPAAGRRRASPGRRDQRTLDREDDVAWC